MKSQLPVVIFVALLSVLFFVSLPKSETTKVAAKTLPPRSSSHTTIQPTLSVSPSLSPQPVYAAPKTVSIPKIGLMANVVSVGLDSENRMDVPNNFVDVAWYNLGAKPGQLGSTVLDGHNDNFHGEPAVFYYLDTLTKGDQILITDQNGRHFTYTVTDNIVYPVDKLPLQQIFAANDAVRLNIITCHGQWDSSIQTYNQRTVIYSVLSQTSDN